MRLDRRQRSPGLHFGVNGRHLLICLVQLLVRLRVVPLLLLVFRERLLLGRAVLLYLEHKVNNYSPNKKGEFQGLSEGFTSCLSHSPSLTLPPDPEKPHLEQSNSMQAQLGSRL